MKTSERITQVADRIEAVLASNAEPGANTQAMGELRAAALALGAGDPYASGKLVELMAKAQVFYGPRSIFRLPGTGRRLWNDMHEDLLDRLRMRARVLASRGD
ncbi:MAG: hypothetical protein ACJ8G7_03885 [Rhizobacter sp.]